MQYKIDATPEQIRDLKTHVFNEYPIEIKNKQLVIEAGEHTAAFLSMIRAFTKTPVSIDYMTRDLIKFVVL